MRSTSFAFFIFIIIIYSCSSPKPDGDVFNGGRIINPIDSLVYLSKDGFVIDSVLLNEFNDFSFTLENIQPDLL